MPGARAPAAACAEKSTRVSHHGYAGTPGIPARNGLTVSSALSPATNSSCHRRRRIKRFRQTRSGPQNLRRLDTSNGCQDHTASPYATTSFVCAPFVRSRAKPALRSPCAPDAAASTASHPASVTIAIRPSRGTGRRNNGGDLGLRRSDLFFATGLDRVVDKLPDGQISRVCAPQAVIARSQRVGAKRRPMSGAATRQSSGEPKEKNSSTG